MKDESMPGSSASSSKDCSPRNNFSGDSSSNSKKVSKMKILKRSEQGSVSSTNLNANSEPFVPKAHVEVEDTNRTQFKPKLVILKREKPDKNRTTDASDPNCASTSRVVKTYEEREKDYMKARERILGSAVSVNTPEVNISPLLQTSHSTPLLPTPPGPPQTVSQPPHRRNNSPLNQRSGQLEVPLLRQPQGPSSDGNRGFTRVKR